MSEINVKSDTINKGLDLAKEFLGKLISSGVEELGLLISDNIRFIRFKNQVRILLKAKKYVEEKKINLKEIPIKILVPLLENASLEEDEELQDKWAKMIANMANSDYNLQNHVFPYLLSQISISEFRELKELQSSESTYWDTTKKYYECLKNDQFSFNADTKLAKEAVSKINQNGFSVNLEPFEIENLERLKLIKQLPPRIYINEFRTGGTEQQYEATWHQLDAEYDPNDNGHRITQLGSELLELCNS